MKPIHALRLRQPDNGPYVPTGAISFVGSGSGAGSSGTTTFPFSSLLGSDGTVPVVQTGDLIIVLQGSRYTSAIQLTPPAGYTTAIPRIAAVGSSHTALLQLCYKFMGGTPDTSVAVPGSSGGWASFVVHVLRGVSQGVTLDSVAPVSAQLVNAVGAPDAPTIMPATSGDWIYVCGVVGTTGFSPLTNPANLSAAARHFTSATMPSNAGCSAAGLKLDWESGEFDPAAFGGGATAANGGVIGAALTLRAA
jgi:hypothetical protein